MEKLRSLSYSFLQKLDLGPQYINVKEEEADYFVVGSLVDALLTEPDKVDDKFCFYLEDRIGPSVKKILDKLNKNRKGSLEEKDILEVAKEQKYGDGWRPETVIRKIKEAGEEYLKFLKECERKTVVTKIHYDTATKVVDSLLNDPYTRSELKTYGNHTELLTQLKIDWTYDNLPATSRLDYLLIDHKHKTLTPKDLKTTGNPVYEFPKSYVTFGYYMQASFYNEAVIYWKNQHPEYRDYAILPFKFIVESTRITGYPMIFEASAMDIHCGKWGGLLGSGRKTKGFDALVKEYKWYIENDVWTHTKEYIENKGKLYLNAFEEI